MNYYIPALMLLAVAGWALARTGKVLTSIVLDITNVVINKISLKESIISFDLVAKNPTKKEAKLQSYDLRVNYLDKTIATLFKTGLNVGLAANDTTVIKGLQAKISSMDILNSVLDIFSSNTYDNKILIEGTIRADGLAYPVKKTITFTQDGNKTA